MAEAKWSISRGFDQDKESTPHKTSTPAVLLEEPTAIVKNESQFQQEAITLVDTAKALVVDSQESYELAVDFGKGVSSFIKKVEAFFKPLKATAKAAHQALCDKENEILKVPKQADEIAKDAARVWKAEQKRIADQKALIEQARLQKQAEEDRKKLLKELAKTGNKAAVAQAKAAPLEVPQVEAAPAFQKVSGTRNRTVWHFRIDDESQIPESIGICKFWMIDEKAIREYVGAMREQALPGAAHALPGVTVWSSEETDW